MSFCSWKKLPIVLHLVITVLPVTPSSTHTAQPLAFRHPVPHSNWSILLKYDSERGVSVCHVNQHNVWFSLCEAVRRSVCVLSCTCHFQWCHVFLFLCLFSSVLLDRLCCSSLSPPLTPRLCSGFCLLSPCIRVSLLSCWYRRRAAEHSGIPVDFFFFLFPFSVLIVLQ